MQIMKARFIITCTHVDFLAVVLIILYDTNFKLSHLPGDSKECYMSGCMSFCQVFLEQLTLYIVYTHRSRVHDKFI